MINIFQFGYVELQAAFIVLKLSKVIDWSWWWVLTPIWLICARLLVLFIWIIRVKSIRFYSKLEDMEAQRNDLVKKKEDKK